MNFDDLRLWIETLFEELNVWIQSINDVIWGWPMLIVLLGTHLFLTFKLRFPQRYTFKGIRLSVKSEKDSEGDKAYSIKGEFINNGYEDNKLKFDSTYCRPKYDKEAWEQFKEMIKTAERV